VSNNRNAASEPGIGDRGNKSGADGVASGRTAAQTTSNRKHTERSDRAVTVTLNYILVLAITATLVSGLLVAAGTFVEDQRERVIEGELDVIGNHIAGDVEQVDRMVRASNGAPDRAEINQSFQETVGGTGYNVRLEQNPDRVVLESNSPAVTVSVNVTVQTDIEESFAPGGDSAVRYDATADRLVIADD
jgi:hypothetical protein